MKRIFLWLLILCLTVLTACNTVQYKSNDTHFQIDFPKSMTVLSPVTTKADDPALAEFGIEYEQLVNFGKEDGVFYGVEKGEQGTEEMIVTVSETALSQEIWHLKETDISAVNEFEQAVMDSFTSSGLVVRQKGNLRQDDAYCFFVNVGDATSTDIHLIYMATICNGLLYSVTYQSETAANEAKRQDVYTVFESFYVTEISQNPDGSQTGSTAGKAIVAIVLILIAAAIVITLIRIFTLRHRKQDDPADYTPQFQNHKDR